MRKKVAKQKMPYSAPGFSVLEANLEHLCYFNDIRKVYAQEINFAQCILKYTEI